MRPVDRRAVASGLLAAGLWAASAAPIHAQTWPSRPVTMVVPFTPGTTSDVIARSLAQELSAKLGQPFVVENKGGAGGNIGAAFVARAPADGYTVLFATTGQAATNKLMYKQMEFDPQRDFAPVVLVSKAPVIITASRTRLMRRSRTSSSMPRPTRTKRRRASPATARWATSPVNCWPAMPGSKSPRRNIAAARRS